jgi:hypothetical protein
MNFRDRDLPREEMFRYVLHSAGCDDMVFVIGENSFFNAAEGDDGKLYSKYKFDNINQARASYKSYVNNGWKPERKI